MKTLRQTCAVAILSLALAVSTFAGQIDSPGAPAPAASSTTLATSTITTTLILTITSLIR